ncbi:MAG: carboxypeptidase regulatory-like domain-containing protein [Bacteroidales bacterium]|nr:carboxypeptidase regulatory-like domain-containing protein [Bacteroidales bacterium]
MRKNLLVILFLFVSLGLFAQETNLNKLMQDRNEYYFTFELNGNDNLPLIAQTISVDRVDGNVVTAYANNKEFAEFQKLGYEITLQTPPSMLEEHVMWDGSNRAEYDWDQYPTYSAYESMMYAFQTNHPDKCEIIELGTLPSNRKILIAHINNGSGAGKPKFLYTSTIHGDETTGWMLMLRWIDYILENPTLPECANILENVDLYVGPNTNPDGTYHGGNNSVTGATRYNANGVDMNRNYADPHGSAHPDGNPYAQETEWFMQLAQENHFIMGANYHGGAEVMNYPWDNTHTLHADDAWWQLVSLEYVALCRQVSSSYMTDTSNNGITNGAAWYMIGGGRQDYMNGYAQCREITIECSSTKCPNASQMPNFWNINKNSIFAFVNQVLYGIHGTVVDAATKAPIGDATVTMVGHDDQYSFVYSQLPGGDFHRPIKAGTYNVRITKNGYQPYETQVTVADNQTVTINAEMVALEGLVADFVADVTAVSVGGSVHFTDNSWGAQITNWDWEFEGGTPATSTAQNPTVTYNEAGTFGVRLTVTNAAGETNTKYMPNYISASESYNMQNGTITTCDAMFYDDGGPNSNYGNNKNLTMTFMPASEGGIIEVTFQSFETENNYDFLYIYDGTSTSAPQIGNGYSGGSNPGTVTATNSEGALTFRFTSDSSVNKEGWAAHVRCLGLPLEIEASVESDTICTAQTNMLFVSAAGGSGNYTYSWSPADYLDDATSQTPVFTPGEIGDYTYTVTVSDGTESMSETVSFTVTECDGVAEIPAENVEVYPNPASSMITIEGIGNYNNLEVVIVNLQGQVVKTVNNSLEINVQDVKSGVYFININCDGSQMIKKIVVE